MADGIKIIMYNEVEIMVVVAIDVRAECGCVIGGMEILARTKSRDAMVMAIETNAGAAADIKSVRRRESALSHVEVWAKEMKVTIPRQVDATAPISP